MTIDGKTIVITRSENESGEFISSLKHVNAIPFALPTIQIIKKNNILDKFINSVIDYKPHFSIFMSAKAVKLLFSEATNVSRYNKLQLAIANTIVVAVGPKTKCALEHENIKVSYMPTRYSSVGIGEIFTKLNAYDKKVIVPRSSASTPFLFMLLQKIGLHVKENYVYDTITFHDVKTWTKFHKLFIHGKVDGIIFTSSSSVKSFFEIILRYCDSNTIENKLRDIKIVSIGPTTSHELVKFNVKNITAKSYTIKGAIKTISAIL